MIVTYSKDNHLVFNTGLEILGEHSQDCCESNYLDFEQLPFGTELPDMDAAGFYKAMKLKDDGFIIKDIHGVPKWVQARSNQNGYYSHGVSMVLISNGQRIRPERIDGEYGELFQGTEG